MANTHVNTRTGVFEPDRLEPERRAVSIVTDDNNGIQYDASAITVLEGLALGAGGVADRSGSRAAFDCVGKP
jgi:hypothetical protein